MNIALTTWGFPTPYSKSTNGIAVYTEITSRYLARLGHDVTVVTSYAQGMPNHYQTECGVQVYQSPPGNIHWYLSKAPHAGKKLITYIKLWEIGKALIDRVQKLGEFAPFDIVEVGPPAAWLYPVLKKNANTKIISTLHGCVKLVNRQNGSRFTMSDRFWHFAEEKAAWVADELISPSQYVADFYCQEYGRMPNVLPLPVEINENQQDRKEHSVHILVIGGADQAKGADILINAFPRLLEKYPQVRFSLIAAESNHELNVFQQNNAHSERVLLLPWMPHAEICALYRQVDVFISASHFETFGLTLAEAMGAGLAVVASDIPAHRELIQKSGGGRLFKSGSADALCNELAPLIEDANLRTQIGVQARQWVKINLDPMLLTQERIKFYLSALSKTVSV